MLSFYVHIPYCVRRCGYCDFNTYTPSELQDGATLEIVSGDYIDAVLKELDAAPKDVVPTIFFGGGTPSLLPPKDLGRVITAIKARNGITDDCEITLEANPDSVTQEKLNELFAVGFNRISFGMQSSNPEVLKVLDRTHNPENVRKAVDMARIAGFQLIVEEGTKLAAQIKRGEYTMPDDDLMADMYLLVDQQCLQKGLKWYELSNWSKPGHQCRHNIAYWKSNNWWGLGPGAHSHIDQKRFWNVKHPNAYKEKVFAGLSPIKDSEILSDDEKKSEYIMLAIRMPEGVKKAALTVAQYERSMEYIKSGHVIEKENALALTPKGRLIADRITHEMLR